MRIGIRVTPEAVIGVSIAASGLREYRRGIDHEPGGLERALGDVLAELHCGGAEMHSASINFEVSELFSRATEQPVIAVRIAPRAPLDTAHAYSGSSVEQRVVETIHVRGGHSDSGEELAPFAGDELTTGPAEHTRPGRYVITSVGGTVNPAHELEAGRLLFDTGAPVSVSYSHSFHNTSFSVRERTGVLNSSHLNQADTIATTLATVSSNRVPGARLFVVTNDGGAMPLAALALKPVHSLYSGAAAEFVGAMAFAGVDDGRIVISRADEVRFGEVVEGVPTVVSRSRDESGELIATRTIHLAALAGGSIGEWMNEPVALAIDELGGSTWESVHGHEHTEIDLGATGAACSQLVEWSESSVQINTLAEKEQALAAAEAKVRARLVSYGARPSEVRIIDSRVVGASYQNPSVVTVRVRGAAGPTAAEIMEAVAK